MTRSVDRCHNGVIPTQEGSRRRGARPWQWVCFIAIVAMLVDPAAVLAHGGGARASHDVWSLWEWDPVVLAGLGLGGWLYARGLAHLWHRAGVGRGVRRWQAVAFGCGLAALAVALISPLAGLSQELFAAHMLQHLLLLLVAPPLLLLGEPQVVVAMALPRGWRRPLATAMHRVARYSLWGSLTAIALIWVVQMVALWGWHHPLLYEAALRSQPLHVLEHISFVVTALLFWEVAIRPFASKRHGGYWTAILFVVATALPNGLLGALMTFASRPWYSAYTERVAFWGLTPLEDQQVAGLLMWIPPGLVYVVVVAALLLVWLDRGEVRDARYQARHAAAAGEIGM